MSSRRFQKLDVRPYLKRGEEPFPIIMEKIDSLPPGDGLELTAPFMPAPLVEMLGNQGFEVNMERADDGAWIVWFWRGS